MKIYEEFIRSHLPKELADRPISDFNYYFLDGMNVMTEGERGGDDVLVYKAKSEEDLMLWQYSEVCRFIGDWPEFDKKMGYPKRWRYYRAYAENNRWKYIEYTKYDYNAIEDSRLHGFEQYLALVKIGFPPDRWEKEVKIHIDLMNYWYSKPHWDYDREKLCFIEISNTKEHDEHSNPIDEPRPGSIIKVVDDYYSCSKFTEISEEAQEEDSQGSSNNIDKDKIGTDEVRIENIWILKDIALEMVYCPKGSFRMGSPKKREEYPPHQVKLRKPFYIGKYPVTQMQYYAIMKKQPSFFKGEDRPVESVSWDDAKEFVENINSLYKRQLPEGYKFALPSEAQWEYACRAGTTSDLNNGRNIISGTGKSDSLDEVAFYIQNSDDRTHPVGKKKPNAWGIYDMHGNVCEWCEDIYDYYPERDVTDPTGPESGSYHVLRGGSYLSNPGTCRSASRYYNYHDDKQKFMGFRLAMIKE